MTKKEKQLIKKAIRLIHNENNYNEGMEILLNLIGMKSFYSDLGNKSENVMEIMKKAKGKNQEFTFKGRIL